MKAIEAAQETNDPKAAIAQVVESDPDLAAIATRLLIPKDAAQFWAFVAVVISILQLVTSGPGSTTVIQQQIKVIKKIKKPQSSQKATKKKKQARGKRQKPQQQKKGSKQRRK